MTSKLLVVLCACGAAFSSSAAETVYVTDSLKLGLFRTEDTNDAPFQTLSSGAGLEVLERNASYARVRTEDGQVGWVKTAYLVAQKPAVRRVAELEAELDSLRAELDDAHRDSASITGVAKTALATPISGDVAGAENAADLRIENARLEASLDQFRGSLPLPWVIAALVVVAAGGFLAGLWWLDALIRRRHGGFRVY
jgi:hypothetical protein